MSYLTIEKRKKYFKALGLGEYNKENILKFEKKYLPSKYCDGEYGTVTDNLLRHCINVASYTKNFKPQEFRCPCGKCSGYPSYMKMNELKNIQTIRTKFGRPMTITSGMRCKSYNSSLKGSSVTSKHLTGQAVDFYIQGVTDTLVRRKTLIAYMKTLPAFNWAYGNGWCSKGYAVNAPNMGNAVHLDSLINAEKTTGEKICDEADKLVKAKLAYCYYKDNKGWPKGKANCIRAVALALYNAGIKVSTKMDGLLNDAWATKLLKLAKTSPQKALAEWKKRNGENWDIVYNKGNKIPISMLKEGDVLLCYKGETYKHTASKHRGANIFDCNPSKGAKIRAYSALNNVCKLAFRYVGK